MLTMVFDLSGEVSDLEISETSDLALRIILCLYSFPPMRSSKEISLQLDRPHDEIKSGLSLLLRSNLVCVSDVDASKYMPARPPQELSLYDVLTVTEEKYPLNRCLEEDAFCSRYATRDCPVRRTYVLSQNLMEIICVSITFDRVLNGSVEGLPYSLNTLFAEE